MAPLAFIRCPQCNTVIEKPATGEPVCPNCGFGAPKPAKKAAAKGAGKSAAKAAPTAPAPAPAPAAWTPAPQSPPLSPPSVFSAPDAPVPTNSGKAVAALVLGIVGCCVWVIPFAGPFIALPCGILALVFGILGTKEIRRQPATFKGNGLAITGIVLGSIMVFVGILLIIALTVGIGAIEEYCRENPDTEGCDDFNGASSGGIVLDRLAGVPVAGALVTRLRLA